MIDDLIAAWREDGIPHGTHYENCGKHHARCAISLLAQEVEHLRALIIEWAEASDAWDGHAEADKKERAAIKALRKEVGLWV